jgi:hypothetical protein
MKFGAKKNPTVPAGGHVSRQISFKIYTVLKKRLWESRSTPTLGQRESSQILMSRQDQTTHIFNILMRNMVV